MIERRIVHEDQPDALFRGSARFTPDEDGMVYEERGLMKIDGLRPVSAQRRYLWRENDDGAIEVRFEDGRAFHRIDPDNPADTHWCDPDMYEVTYRFGQWPDWIVTWKVSGPRKAYQMVSTYRRPVEGID